jgi:hypothetical protein
MARAYFTYPAAAALAAAAKVVKVNPKRPHLHRASTGNYHSLITHIKTATMSVHSNDQTVLAEQHHNKSNPNSLGPSEFIGEPIGTFAGTQDRILRIRDGEKVPADTGEQGGGQN